MMRDVAAFDVDFSTAIYAGLAGATYSLQRIQNTEYDTLETLHFE